MVIGAALRHRADIGVLVEVLRVLEKIELIDIADRPRKERQHILHRAVVAGQHAGKP